MKKVFLTILAIITLSQVYSQEFRKYTNNFLYNGFDARGIALGNSVVASSGDVFASFWNPAGMQNLDSTRTQIGYMHVFDGLYNFDVAGVAFPTKNNHVLTLSGVRYGVDDIPNTIFLVDESGNIDSDNITTFSAADYGVFISYSKPIKSEKITIGGSAKIIHRNYGEFAKAWGGGIDIGARYRSLNSKLQMGALIKDLVGTYTSWDFNFSDPEIVAVFEKTGNEIPKSGSIEATSPSLVLGALYRISAGKFNINPEANLDVTFDGKRNTFIKSDPISIDPHLGIEVGFDNMLFARGGINNLQEITDSETEVREWSIQPSAGAGIKLPGFELDYALTQYDLRQEVTHLVTLKLGLVKPRSQQNSSDEN